VKPSGESKVLFDSPETHLRSLAVKSDGSLLVGGSGKGRIYEVKADGSAHALYDSSMNEISTIYVDSSGIGWAAGVSNQLPDQRACEAAAGEADRSAIVAFFRRRQRRSHRRTKEGRAKRRSQRVVRGSRFHTVAKRRQRRVVQDQRRWLRGGRAEVR